MCGQYSYLASKKALLERYQLNPADIDSFVLDYAIEEAEQKEDTPNIFYPSGHHPILLPNQKIYHIQWGLTPSFAKRPLINARLETIMEKKTFRDPFMKSAVLYQRLVFMSGKQQMLVTSNLKRCIVSRLKIKLYFQWLESVNGIQMARAAVI